MCMWNERLYFQPYSCLKLCSVNAESTPSRSLTIALKAMRQMIAVTSMYDHAFHAFAVKLAGGWAGAMVLARSLHLFEELVLHFGGFFPSPGLE